MGWEYVMALSKKAIRLFIFAVGLTVAGVFVWNWAKKVEVEISSYYPETTIELASANTVHDSNLRWFTVAAGPNRLSKGSYYFRLAGEDLSRNGLIAVDDSTAIVLK